MSMTKELFFELVKDSIKNYLPGKYAGAEVVVREITKTNDTVLHGLSVIKDKSGAVPVVYLDSYYQNYKGGKDMEDIITDLAEVIVRSEIQFDTRPITDWNVAKNLVVPRLVNAEYNKSLLKKAPHTMMADLAIVYYIAMPGDEGTNYTTIVTNELMKAWGVNADELHNIALNNLSVNKIGTIDTMANVLTKMGCVYDLSEDEIEALAAEDLLILSNKQHCYGTAAILDKDLMAKVEKIFDSDFYVIPSSVHELLLMRVPATLENDTAYVKDMVRNVNDTSVDSTEILSYNVYKYRNGTLEIL